MCERRRWSARHTWTHHGVHFDIEDISPRSLTRSKSATATYPHVFRGQQQRPSETGAAPNVDPPVLVLREHYSPLSASAIRMLSEASKAATWVWGMDKSRIVIVECVGERAWLTQHLMRKMIRRRVSAAARYARDQARTARQAPTTCISYPCWCFEGTLSSPRHQQANTAHSTASFETQLWRQRLS